MAAPIAFTGPYTAAALPPLAGTTLTAATATGGAGATGASPGAAPARPTRVDASRPIAYAGFATVIERLDYTNAYPPVITRAATSNLATDFPNRATLTYA